ncbi:hypothetical protein FDA94_28650 [Herbidospora galbida]|uniref:Uncharacterized protein n=1 Tax=Herbidospora galbida TaxID=2575442 RepID=A0A4U3M8G7_9ACTN|nr:hypothetical protein [Herbidospora galbida]TKK84602.1 hypothetical protein FDA94_28650 [Herbidospora galbida]
MTLLDNDTTTAEKVSDLSRPSWWEPLLELVRSGTTKEAAWAQLGVEHKDWRWLITSFEERKKEWDAAVAEGRSPIRAKIPAIKRLVASGMTPTAAAKTFGFPKHRWHYVVRTTEGLAEELRLIEAIAQGKDPEKLRDLAAWLITAIETEKEAKEKAPEFYDALIGMVEFLIESISTDANAQRLEVFLRLGLGLAPSYDDDEDLPPVLLARAVSDFAERSQS